MHVTKNILHINSTIPTVQVLLVAVQEHIWVNISLFTIHHFIDTQVPVILGIWGPNGNGKTFQTQLVYKLLGIDAKTITAEELFHADGATAANLILDNYFAASDAISMVCV